jgi:hypothetical protein
LVSESETCVGSRVHLVGVSISFEKNFYRLPFTPPSLVRRIGPSADQALAQLKDFLAKPPVLMAPRKKEQLLFHLAATTHVVSTAIVVERQEDGHAYPVQRPVYFVSEVLSESKARYQPVQKILYAVLITSRKIRHYF